MNTDKEVYQILSSCPKFIFECAGLKRSGKGKFESVTVKALERTIDGLFRPTLKDEPLMVVEIQFQRVADIYTRLVTEMAFIQEQNDFKEIEGIVFFASQNCDPGTYPWTEVIKVVHLDDALEKLEKKHAGHPLVAVFKPVMIKKLDELENEASRYYRHIRVGF